MPYQLQLDRQVQRLYLEDLLPLTQLSPNLAMLRLFFLPAEEVEMAARSILNNPPSDVEFQRRLELVEAILVNKFPQLSFEQVLQMLDLKFLREPPEVKFGDVRYLLESFGLEEKRSRGSHHTFRNVEGLKITIPKTGGRMVKGVYVRQIVKLLNLEESGDENSN